MRRRSSLWPAAIALALSTAPAAVFAQNPTPATPAPAAPPSADMPPPPPAQPMPPRPMPMMPPPAVKRPPAPPGVAAVVNGKKITTAEVKDFAYKIAGTQAVDQIILNNLVDMEAKKQNVTVAPAEIAAKVADFRVQVARQGSGKTLEQVLAEHSMTLPEFKENLRRQIEVTKLVTNNTPPMTLIHVRHILIATHSLTGDPTAKPAHTEPEAKALITKIQDDLKAGKSFEDEAKLYSEDASNKDRGGDLGIIGPNTPFDPTFLQAALKLKAGETTAEPVLSTFGYHLIKADSTSANPPAAEKAAYATAAQQMQQQQAQNAIQPYLAQLRQKYTVINYLAP